MRAMLFALAARAGCLGRDERGTTAIEYSLLASLIGIGIIAALQTMSGYLNSTFNSVSSSL